MEKGRADASAVPGEGRGGPRRQEPPSSAGPGYRFSLDVSGFAAEELWAELAGRRLTVCARKAEAANDGGSGGFVSHRHRERRQRLLLPDDADLGALVCSLDGGGRLCVEVPRLAPEAARPSPGPSPDAADGTAALPASPEAAP